MDRTRLEPGIINFPMPVAVLGTEVDGKVNFLTVAWISMVSYAPPMVAVTLGNHHHSNRGIKEHRSFSLNFPTRDHVVEVDYVGLASGVAHDKSRAFSHERGELAGAPLVSGFPLSVECRLERIVENGRNETFIGEIVAMYADAAILREGKVDMQTMSPLVLSQVDQVYLSLGPVVGRAWDAGKTLMAE